MVLHIITETCSPYNYIHTWYLIYNSRIIAALSPFIHYTTILQKNNNKDHSALTKHTNCRLKHCIWRYDTGMASRALARVFLIVRHIWSIETLRVASKPHIAETGHFTGNSHCVDLTPPLLKDSTRAALPNQTQPSQSGLQTPNSRVRSGRSGRHGSGCTERTSLYVRGYFHTTVHLPRVGCDSTQLCKLRSNLTAKSRPKLQPAADSDSKQ